MTDPTDRIPMLHDALDDGDVARRAIFGRSGLATRGKVFVYADRDGRLVMKLGDDRGAEYVAEGIAESAWMGPRQVRDWYAFDVALDDERALQLAADARDHVRALLGE